MQVDDNGITQDVEQQTALQEQLQDAHEELAAPQRTASGKPGHKRKMVLGGILVALLAAAGGAYFYLTTQEQQFYIPPEARRAPVAEAPKTAPRPISQPALETEVDAVAPESAMADMPAPDTKIEDTAQSAQPADLPLPSAMTDNLADMEPPPMPTPSETDAIDIENMFVETPETANETSSESDMQKEDAAAVQEDMTTPKGDDGDVPTTDTADTQGAQIEESVAEHVAEAKKIPEESLPSLEQIESADFMTGGVLEAPAPPPPSEDILVTAPNLPVSDLPVPDLPGVLPPRVQNSNNTVADNAALTNNSVSHDDKADTEQKEEDLSGDADSSTQDKMQTDDLSEAEKAIRDNMDVLEHMNETEDQLASLTSGADINAQSALIRPLPKSYLVVKKDHLANDVDARISAARQAMAQNRPTTALALFSEVLQDDKQNARAMMGQAVAMQRLGMDTEALGVYEKVLMQDPKNLEALTNMLGLIEAQDPSMALERLKELRERYPANADITAQLGIASGAAGEYKNALRYLDMAGALGANQGTILYNKAVVYDRMGQAVHAANYYREILTLSAEGRIEGFPVDMIRKRLATLR